MKLFLSTVLILSLVFNPVILLAEESTAYDTGVDSPDPFLLDDDLFSDTPSTDDAALPGLGSADTIAFETEKPAAEAKKKVTKKKKKAAKKSANVKKAKKSDKTKKAVKAKKTKKKSA